MSFEEPSDRARHGEEPREARDSELPLSTERQDFYQDFRRKVRDWLDGKGQGYKYADLLLVGPDLFHLLCRLVADPRVPIAHKVRLGATIAFFASPVDIVPEGIVGLVGYVDDVALAAYVLRSLLGSDDANIAREHWAGEGDALAVVQRTLTLADSALGSGIWAHLKNIVASRSMH